jgi:hypothetical protein
MKCCQGNKWTRRATGAAGWAGPGALLVLMPKCPMCVAGYLALAGVEISLTAASYLRWSMLVLCVATLGLMSWRLLRRKLA